SQIDVLSRLRDSFRNQGMVAGSSFAKGIASGFEDFPFGPVLISTLVGAIVLALPAIGAVLAGAVTGVAGGGGIVGGIVAAKDDPAVRRAWSDFADTAKSELHRAGEAFVAPLQDAAQVLKTGLVRLNLAAVLEPMAPELRTLAIGLGGFGQQFATHFGAAL